jgi:hypothetical protein
MKTPRTRAESKLLRIYWLGKCHETITKGDARAASCYAVLIAHDALEWNPALREAR